MAEFRPKIARVQAFFLDENTTEFPDWWRKARDIKLVTIHQNKLGKIWYRIKEPNGEIRHLLLGRYIYLNENGNIYPMSKEFFETHFEKIDGN